MATSPSPGSYRVGDGVFDPSDGTWTVAGSSRILSPRLAQILAVLAAAAPAVVRKDELIARVWDGRPVSDAALTQRIKELRRILGDDARRPRIIQTAAKRGYRLLAPVSAAGACDSGARTILTRALVYADRFEWGKAHDLLHAVVTAEPGLAIAWAWLAYAHLWREDPEGATVAAATAAGLIAGASEADRHFILATHASFSGQLADMIDHLELLLADSPDDFWGAYRLAHAYLLASRVDDSLRMREHCDRLRPDHPFNLSERGFTRLFAAGDVDGAAADYTRVVALAPNHPFAIPFLMPSFRAWLAGDLATTRTVLDEVLDRRLETFLPLGRVSALVHDARFRLFVGDAATALADLQRAAATARPGSTLEGWARLELALTLLDLGDTGAALVELAAVECAGTSLNQAEAWLWLGVCAARAGDAATATALAAALRNTPHESCREFGYPTGRVIERVRRVFPLLVQGELALAKGNGDTALAAFSDAAAALPLRLDAPVPLSTTDPRDHLLALEGIARAHAALGAYEAAITAETRLLDQRLVLFITARAGVGSYFSALARRAGLLLASGRRHEAAADASEVITRWGGLAPEPPAVRVARALALAPP